MNIDWDINTLQSYTNYQGRTDVVFKLFWRILASEEANNQVYTYNYNGITELNLGSLDPFTPFNDLTEPQVINWITSSMDYPALTAFLYEELQKQINPVVVDLRPPWN